MVLLKDISLRVVSKTGWLVVGKAKIDLCNSHMSSKENSEALISPVLVLVGDSFCLYFAGLEVLEESVEKGC